MAALPPEKLAQMKPSLLRVFSSHEAELIQYIGMIGELSGLPGAAELAEGRQLIAQGCQIVRQAIARAGAKDSSAT